MLLVEDSARLRSLVSEAVRAAGWRIDAVATIGEAEEALSGARYDVMLLDLGLPDGDGVDFVRERRAARDQTPVLVLSARSGIDDRIAGLDAGADDYLVKPFNSRELLARARALVRRAPLVVQPVLEAGALRYDPATAMVSTAAGEDLQFTPRERALMEILMRNVGRVATASHIEEALSEAGEPMTRNAVELIVSRLRRKIAPYADSVTIETIRSVGYLMREVG